MQIIKVVIIDDHPLFRQGVVDTLSLEPDIDVKAQASDGDRGLDLIRKLRPDVAVVDINLPGLNGHQITGQILLEKIPTRVVLLTAYDDHEQRIFAMRGGAAAYCSKDVQADRLVDVIRTVSAGNYLVGDRVYLREEFEDWLEGHKTSTSRVYSISGESNQPLTAREMEVLLEVTQGKSNKEIALHLGISHQTVKNHVTSIFRKLDVEDRTQAAIYALRQGWVRLYPDKRNSQE
jgi:DNA-binding NarL/FixJ family response regulator